MESFFRRQPESENLLMRVATSSFNVSALGDIVFGLACLVIYGLLVQVSFAQIFSIALLVLISVVVFLAAAIAAYSASFLFTDANSVTSGLFELFTTPSLFHGGAFQGATRLVFTFLIPSLVVGALPVEIVKNVSLEQFAVVGIVAVVWFFLSLKLFSWGVKKYESTNFMTFWN